MKRRLLILQILILALTIVVLSASAKTQEPSYIVENTESITHNNKAHPALVEGENSWPMAGANPERTSWTPEEVTGPLKPVWFRPIEPYISQKTQIIAAYGTLYIATARGLYTLDAETGAEGWVYPTELPLGHSPTVADGVVYVGGFDRKIHAIDAFTGASIWTFDEALAGYHTNPLVVNGMVYAGNRDGYFYAVNAATGQLAWKYKTDGPILYSAAYKDNSLYFASEDSHAYALNANTGGLIWKSLKLPGAGFQSWWPVIYRDRVIFSGSNNYRSSISPGGSLQFTQLEKNDLYPNHNSDPRGTLVGVAGQVPGDWAAGTSTVDMSKSNVTSNGSTTAVTKYFENKPWRRTYFVLNRATGVETTYDFDNNGQPEYAPILWVGTHSGTRYPPVIGGDDVIYQSNNFYSDPHIAGGHISGWKLDSPIVSLPTNGWNAVDEPQAYSAGGNLIYWNRCCDRIGGSIDISLSGNGGNYFVYDLDSLIPEYNVRYHLSDTSPYASFGAPSINGVYGYHADTNPPIPYNNKIYMHRGNSIIAFEDTNESPTMLPMFNEVAAQPSTPTLDVPYLQQRLVEEVQKILDAGHLRPGYTGHGIFDNFSRHQCSDNFTDYWHNTGETIYILLQTLPFLSPSMQQQVENYLQNELQDFPPYSYNHIGWSGAAREVFTIPPDAALANHLNPSPENYTFKNNGGWESEGVWGRNPFAYYALWKYADAFGGASNILQASENAFWAEFNSQPSDTLLMKMPHVHNAYIAGYKGFVELQALAQVPVSTQVNNELNRLLNLRATTFTKESAYGNIGTIFGAYCRTLNISNNFMFLVPELAEYLRLHNVNAVQAAVNEYDDIAPYWFVSLATEGFGENAITLLTDGYGMFMAKALILQADGSELDRYLDVPGFDTGDLYYIHKLAILLGNPAYGFSLHITPGVHSIESGEDATYSVSIQSSGGFTLPVTLSVNDPYPDLDIDLTPTSVNPPGSANLILTDLHDPSFSDSVVYQLTLVATGDGMSHEVSVYLYVNGEQVYLSAINRR